MRKLLAVACAIAFAGLQPAAAQTFKIGVLNDQSSLYADLTGSGSITSAPFRPMPCGCLSLTAALTMSLSVT